MRRPFVILCFLFAALRVFVVSQVSAATVTVRAPSVEAQAGGAVDVPIQLAGAQGLGAVHVELVYDPNVLTAESVSKGALAGSNALVESNLKQAGRAVIGVVTLDGISGDGTLATVRFQVKGSAGASSVLNFENNQAWERATHAEVLVNSQPGQVTIAAGLPAWLLPALVALVVILLLAILLFVLLRRRRAPTVIPQPAYAPSPTYAPPPAYTPPPSYAAPPSRPAPSSPPPNRTAPPPNLGMPERSAPATNSASFQRAEDEFFKLKGQVAAGRITQAQFEEQLRALVVQDAQGRYWMLGADSGKWYVHDGTSWVERTPE